LKKSFPENLCTNFFKANEVPCATMHCLFMLCILIDMFLKLLFATTLLMIVNKLREAESGGDCGQQERGCSRKDCGKGKERWAI
jgi:hypothetical protein